jgi:hypothetical protein
MRGSASTRRAREALEALVYELLDAHADTAELAADLGWDLRWAEHVDYLRALQRAGRAALAQGFLEDPAGEECYG